MPLNVRSWFFRLCAALALFVLQKPDRRVVPSVSPTGVPAVPKPIAAPIPEIMRERIKAQSLYRREKLRRFTNSKTSGAKTGDQTGIINVLLMNSY